MENLKIAKAKSAQQLNWLPLVDVCFLYFGWWQKLLRLLNNFEGTS